MTCDIKGRIDHNTKINDIYTAIRSREYYLGYISNAFNIKFSKEEKDSMVTLNDLHDVILKMKVLSKI